MFVFTVGTVVSLLVFVVVISLLASIHIKQWLRQSRCRHNYGIYENMACDAICKKCGKNLGFIGTDENKIRRAE